MIKLSPYTAGRAFASSARAVPSRRALQQPALRRSYADSAGSPKTSSNTLWILSALALTGVGTYIALAPQGTKDDAKDHAKEKVKNVIDKASEEAYERERKRDQERGPKPNPDCDAETRHQGHSETNEHKIRKGKFSGIEFDNHITSHSTDPGKDFERIMKEEAKK